MDTPILFSSLKGLDLSGKYVGSLITYRGEDEWEAIAREELWCDLAGPLGVSPKVGLLSQFMEFDVLDERYATLNTNLPFF